MNCSLMNLHGFSGRLGQLESARATSLAHQSSCQCAASVGSRCVRQTCLFFAWIWFPSLHLHFDDLVLLLIHVFSTPVIIWLTSPDGFFSLRGALDDLRLLHLHCVDEVFGHSFDLSLGRCCLVFLRICGILHLHDLFNDSLDPVMRLSVVGTVCSQLAARLSGFLWSSSSPVFHACRRSVQRLVPGYVRDLLDHAIGNSFLRDKLDHLNNFLLNLWDWNVNDLLHGAILKALLWHDLHTSDVTSVT